MESTRQQQRVDEFWSSSSKLQKLQKELECRYSGLRQQKKKRMFMQNRIAAMERTFSSIQAQAVDSSRSMNNNEIGLDCPMATEHPLTAKEHLSKITFPNFESDLSTTMEFLTDIQSKIMIAEENRVNKLVVAYLIRK